jgi:molybdate transport system substrate-binding protein
MRHRRRGVLRAAGAALAAGTLCKTDSSAWAAAPGVRLLAAASLRELFDDLGRAWQTSGGAPFRAVFAGTPTLVRQLEQGLPADLIVTADAEWMDHLQRAGQVQSSTRFVLAGNRLVLIAPAGSTTSLGAQAGMPLKAALGGQRLAVANVRTVPAGRHARAALQSLRVWDEVSGQLAMTDSVRGALALVARGEAPLGIVYATDARTEPAVRVVATFPEALHPPIVCPVALTTGATHPEAARVLAWLRSDVARSVIRARGFTVPGERAT